MYEHNPEETNEELREMLGSFVSEAFESLDSNEQLIEYLSEEDNADHVNAIFRAFHTIKGLSGFFGMKVINSVTHEAETLLDKIRKQGKPQNEEIINIIYMTFDLIRDLLNKVSIDFTDKEGEDEAENICLLIKDAIDKVESGKAGEVSASGENVPEEDTAPEVEKAVPEKKVIDLTKEAENEDEFLAQFISDSADLLELIMNNLIKMESGESDKALLNETFGAVHSLKGTAGFMSLGGIEEQAFDMETILDSIRAGELELNETIISVLLSNAEIISGMISRLKDKNEPAAKDGQDEEKQVKIELGEKTAETFPAEKAETKEPPKDKIAQKISKQKPAAQVKKDIRVETSKIDKLFDMVGELITIESMVTNNPDLKGLELPNFQKSANLLSKITREIQEITMSVRMMPLEGLFNKMKRLVRDVSVKMDKKVNLIVSGQETEMDKNVIDEISDPLVHILRNSVDHGIETPEKRSAAGKDETGTVKLSAGYEGNEIVISVVDNGKGIDREKIIQKALSRGLIDGNPEELTDKEVNLLILEPGFSTADEITDISGRGVGMDVVKKNIEKLRGKIDIESKLGKGTAIKLRIPLTLAILESMIISVGESRYALPILNVTESFIVDVSQVTRTMDGLELIKLRDEVFPVIRLHELFEIENAEKNLTCGIVIVIESRDKKVCLFVDEIVGQQQAVVKSLTDYIGSVPGLMGCMILGDGNIGLIIDVESLIEMSEKEYNLNNIAVD